MLSKFKLKRQVEIPDNLCTKCTECSQLLLSEQLVNNLYICPECNAYLAMPAEDRIEMICDQNSFHPFKLNKHIANPLDFPKYDKKIKDLRKQTHMLDAIQIGTATIYGQEAVVGVMDSRFMIGSMGSAVGEVLTKAFEYATENRLPVVLYTLSGGARMQEGIVSLMQMAKVSAAIKQHHNAGLFYLPILTNPTTGGVTASFAMLGDIIVAEPNALICFAGPRVIKETIKAELPEGFQRAEFLLDHGFLDFIIGRELQREMIYRMLRIHVRREDAN